jgi:hypothetical protein
MSNLKSTLFGLLSAIVFVLQGCGNSDGGTNNTNQSTTVVAGQTGIAGASSATEPAATGGKSSISATSSNSVTGGSSSLSTDATGGSNVVLATGGAAPTETGGNSAIASSTGGASQIASSTGGASTNPGTGGAKSTGGSSAVQSTTGGASSATGGSNATGGAVATTGGTASTGGSSAVTGTGGSAQCVPTDRTQIQFEPPAVPSPSGCSNPVQDMTFPSDQYNLTYSVAATSESNIYVAVSSYNNQVEKGSVLHWNGTKWNAWGPADFPGMSQSVYDISPLNAVAFSDEGYVLAAGANGTRAALYAREDGGAWKEIGPNFAWWEALTISSVWTTSRSEIFLLAGGYDNVDLNPFISRGKIYRGNASGWTAMQVPQYSQTVLMRKIWGTSANDIFAVGTMVNGENQPVKGILWHYDGCTWSDITLPSDVIQITDVHGSNGTVAIVGYAAGLKAIRLLSRDLMNWTRYNGQTQLVDDLVYMFTSSSLVIGSSHTSPEGSVYSGAARLSGLFNSTWTDPAPIDNTAMEATGFSFVQSHHTLLISAQDGAGTQRARLYKVNCQ